MRTMRPDGTTTRKESVPKVLTAREHARACAAAAGRRMSWNVRSDHLAAARGGARMEDLGASSSTISIGRPQWRHTKVGGFESGWSLAPASSATAAEAVTCTPSSCRAAARLNLRAPLASSP